MAKTYNSSGEGESGPQNAASSPYAKLIPVVVGLLVLILVVSLVMRSRGTQEAAPGATAGASGTTGPAARPNGPSTGQER